MISHKELACYDVCSLHDLLQHVSAPKSEARGQRQQQQQTHEKDNSSASAATSALSSQAPVMMNKKGRAVLTTQTGREIIVFAASKNPQQQDLAEEADQSNQEQKKVVQVFAIDRNCYHVGYPLDLGDIEEVPAAAAAASASASHSDERCSSSPSLLCINCPLHNRIFDLRTGDMIALRPVDDETSTEHTNSFRNKKKSECRGESCGNYQRVHVVELVEEAPAPTLVSAASAEQQGQERNDGGGVEILPPLTHHSNEPSLSEQLLCDVALQRRIRVLVYDSFGYSNPLGLTSSSETGKKKEDAQNASSGNSNNYLLFQNRKVNSDRYNEHGSAEALPP